MKGHKEHHHRKERAKGGEAHGDAEKGKAEWEEDLKEKTHDRVSAPEEDKEADERKRGGRAKRKKGGSVVHHELGKHLGHAKHVGPVHGEKAHHHAGRKPRKSGGMAESHVFSSAHEGHAPEFHKDKQID